jgi:hypothetical protein
MTSRRRKPRYAKQGERIEYVACRKFRVPEGTTVSAHVEGRPHGKWCCIDCGAIFPNNMYASDHVETEPKHRLAWLTWTEDELLIEQGPKEVDAA